MKYDKVHTCDFADEACPESGDGCFVCDFDGVCLGIMIGYDREYPESPHKRRGFGGQFQRVFVPTRRGLSSLFMCFCFSLVSLLGFYDVSVLSFDKMPLLSFCDNKNHFTVDNMEAVC